MEAEKLKLLLTQVKECRLLILGMRTTENPGLKEVLEELEKRITFITQQLGELENDTL